MSNSAENTPKTSRNSGPPSEPVGTGNATGTNGLLNDLLGILNQLDSNEVIIVDRKAIGLGKEARGKIKRGKRIRKTYENAGYQKGIGSTSIVKTPPNKHSIRSFKPFEGARKYTDKKRKSKYEQMQELQTNFAVSLYKETAHSGKITKKLYRGQFHSYLILETHAGMRAYYEIERDRGSEIVLKSGDIDFIQYKNQEPVRVYHCDPGDRVAWPKL